MARDRTEEENRQSLLAAAERLTGTAQGEITVIVVRGVAEVIRPEAPPIRPGQTPEGMSAYDAAILDALTDNPMSAARLAGRAGHRHNSYFRQRLARLVEAGYARSTRRGYSRVGG